MDGSGALEQLRKDLGDEVGRGLALQDFSAIKVLTSGLERRVVEPFYAAGKWRREGRMPWWESYREEPWVVVGHYGRTRLPGDGGGFAEEGRR